jgi:hypothetical protein
MLTLREQNPENSTRSEHKREFRQLFIIHREK